MLGIMKNKYKLDKSLWIVKPITFGFTYYLTSHQKSNYHGDKLACPSKTLL
jgi:hypothetical protein